jgi:hypothetical protein
MADDTEVQVPNLPDTCTGGLPDGYVHQHVGRCFREGVKAGYLARVKEEKTDD